MIRHRDGDFLLTFRDSRKEMYPGCWEASAGGSALAGETPEEGARREMLEETGLEAETLERISVTRKPETRSAVYAFIAVVDCATDSVVLQEGKTVDDQWTNPSAFLRRVREGPVLAIQYPRYKPYLDKPGISEAANPDPFNPRE